MGERHRFSACSCEHFLWVIILLFLIEYLQSGLFWATFTAFIIEFYRQLKPNPEDTVVLLLRDLVSLHLIPHSNIPIPNLDNYPPKIFSQTSPLSPSSQVVRMNAAWVVALLFSLIAALTGILAKQWLRAYVSGIPSSLRDSIRIRQLRYDAFRRWHVDEIVGFLPILMVVSLVFFIYGFLELLWSLNVTIAGISTAIVTSFFAFSAATTVIPTFYVNSPFKSPQAWLVWRLSAALRKLPEFLFNHAPSNLPFISFASDSPTLSLWVQREVEFCQQQADELDWKALARIYTHSFDEAFGTQFPNVPTT